MTELIERRWDDVEQEASALHQAALKYPKKSQSRRDLIAQAVALVSEWRDSQQQGGTDETD